MKTATECCNRNITDILHKKEVDKLKNEIKYMEKNYIPKQKVKDKKEELKKDYEDSKDENGETEYYHPDYTIRKLEELLEDK